MAAECVKKKGCTRDW